MYFIDTAIVLILQFIFAVIVVEAITNIITKSEVFEPIRKFFFVRREKFLFCTFSGILECPYCMSVWIGFFVAFIYWYSFLINPFFIGLVLHRLANLVHHIIDRVWGEKVV